ncbi:FAR1-related sequence 10 [Tanacetum coccineum]|uniref:FAR1-related sequence 10 n=1 Tax=Tanacetum coccineum TaxID=301880 RepID=A0ABQ5I429_9ASTR
MAYLHDCLMVLMHSVTQECTNAESHYPQLDVHGSDNKPLKEVALTAKLEHDDAIKRMVLRKALENIPSGVDKNARQSSGVDKNEKQSSGVAKDAEPYVVRLDEGQSIVPAMDVPSQGNSAFVNDFYSSYNPYVESQDLHFDHFTDLDSLLPTNATQQAENNVVDKDALVNEGENVNEHSEWNGDDIDHSEGNEMIDSSDDDNQDSDYIMDEENYVEEIDVDMEDFHYNIMRVLSSWISASDEENKLDRGVILNLQTCEPNGSANGSDSSGSKVKWTKSKISEAAGDYVLELQQSNPNTTVKIQVQSEADHAVPTRVFRRIYVCLGPLKEGFKIGMREVLRLDGAFMKGSFPRQLLTVVSIDPNDGIYLLAYRTVETENTDFWTWFLTQLGDDLELYKNSNFTSISYRQKGIIPALSKLFPCAKHRFCVKHIHENMKLRWSGAVYKDLLWKCATTTIKEFNLQMQELKAFSLPAYEWLLKIPPQHWAR